MELMKATAWSATEQFQSLKVLKENVCMQIGITVFAVLLATRVLSSHRYKQVKYSRSGYQTPPTLPYWIPFLRHAFSMAWDAKRFAAKCL
jgi:hypothetical protein